MFTIFHVHSTSFEHLEGARRLVWLRDYIEEAAQKLTRDRGRTFPQRLKGIHGGLMFLPPTGCEVFMSASAPLLLLLCCAGVLVLALSTQQEAAPKNNPPPPNKIGVSSGDTGKYVYRRMKMP